MKLTRPLLHKLEESLEVTLTPEQSLIMLHWYSEEPRYGWEEGDFALGIRDVIRYYPDHRPKRAAEANRPARRKRRTTR